MNKLSVAIGIIILSSAAAIASNQDNNQIPITTANQQAAAVQPPPVPPSPSGQMSPQVAMANADKYFRQLDQRMNDMMKDDPFFNGTPMNGMKTPNLAGTPPMPSANFPQIKLNSTANSAVLTFLVPGMEKSNLKVQVNERTLTVIGKYSRNVTAAVSSKDDQPITPSATAMNDSVTADSGLQQSAVPQYSEQITREFSQTITLPDNCERSKISSSYKAGVLTITIPLVKKDAGDDKVIPIN